MIAQGLIGYQGKNEPMFINRLSIFSYNLFTRFKKRWKSVSSVRLSQNITRKRANGCTRENRSENGWMEAPQFLSKNST